VRVLDNFSTGSRGNLDGLDVEIVEGELRSYERVHNAVRGVEVVFHLGALGSVPRSVQDPLTSSASTSRARSTCCWPRATRGCGASSSPPRPRSTARARRCRREDVPPDPISPYGVAKLAAERYCVSFSRVYDSFETVVLRYFNVFGRARAPSRSTPP
jgi:nucleoside-diphosphate-sugar epimerase